MDGKELRKRREAANLSQWKVAVALGKTQGWLSNLEMGYVVPTEDAANSIKMAIKTLAARKKGK